MARTSSTETAIKNMLIPLVQAIGRSGKLLYLIIFLVIGYFVYQFFTKNHIAFDLIYNPEVTEFLKRASENGAQTKNGYEMLVFQAEKSWDIWNR